MAEYKEVEEKDKEVWDELTQHPMQSWAWGEFRKLRQPVTRLGVYDGQKLIKGFLVVWTKVPVVPYYFGYIPMGPIPEQEEIKRLKLSATKQKAIGLRMEPLALKGKNINGIKVGRHLFKPKTYWWNLELSEEELLKRMHPKCRYNIKVAQKHEVKINEGQEYFEDYVSLLFSGTVKRQKVGMHDRLYHEQMRQALGDMARLFVAKYKDQILSTMLVFTWKGKAYYAYGGNSLEHKEVMAPTYLLWTVAKKLKNEGIKIFDLWGAEEGKGFSRFKQQFGADLVEMAGTFDLPVRVLPYQLFRITEEARWRVRRLVRH